MHRKVVPDIVSQQKIELLPAATTVRVTLAGPYLMLVDPVPGVWG